ncbi:A-factor biosynthesis hotdog domain protein [Streptomyces sp. ADI96-02]|uniref:ScbA/BarX family gamma-butyrolactone biosynthesis protein n=1 Tax=unclassified Streptomyces TaxID=2593676 RepID=UPI000F55417E|nr:ScbA/BarX family gamma-butyrolactone biosynthesis protein [Streptomyces sp. ADI96-02]RPK69097.1 A-factor biosynthesis hotdog domain protein [Streptomyces sp. ADI96-02]
MPEAAVLIDPGTVEVPFVEHVPDGGPVHPVRMELVHRSRAEDAFARSWVRRGPDRFSVAAVLPHDHPFFAPVPGDRHDPMLLTEAMRQAAMLAFHAGYGVPLGHHFLMADLDFACRLSRLRVAGGPAEVDIEVTCSELKWRGGTPVQGRVDWVVLRGGLVAATGMGATRFTSPQVYRRMRGGSATPGTCIPDAPSVSPVPAGRGRVEDVVLTEGPLEGVWELRVDTRHPTLFQRPNDHVPGMLLLEAARQAACLVAGPGGFVPAEGSTRFHRYAEFTSPCWIRAVVLPGAAPDTVTVQVTGHQDRSPVFSTVLSGPRLTG